MGVERQTTQTQSHREPRTRPRRVGVLISAGAARPARYEADDGSSLRYAMPFCRFYRGVLADPDSAQVGELGKIIAARIPRGLAGKIVRKPARYAGENCGSLQLSGCSSISKTL